MVVRWVRAEVAGFKKSAEGDAEETVLSPPARNTGEIRS